MVNLLRREGLGFRSVVTVRLLGIIRSAIGVRNPNFDIHGSPDVIRNSAYVDLVLGAFFIASERSDRSSPACLSFFYSSERFVPRFLMTD